MAFLITSKQLFSLNKYYGGKIKVTALKEQVFSHYFGWKMLKALPYREELYDVLRKMNSAGLINFYMCQYYDEASWSQQFEEASSPKVLILDHLKVGFYIHIILLIISFIVFICEYFWPRIKLFVLLRMSETAQ